MKELEEVEEAIIAREEEDERIILQELEEIFVEYEEYEKCKTLSDWRTKLIKFQ